jgi:MYXO-CTERM domain-containing protein
MRYVAVVWVICLAVTAARAGVIAGYDSGVLPAAGQAGAANPATQGWTFHQNANAWTDGFDSGNGGWRTVDGTSTGPANYQYALSAGELAAMGTNGWRLNFTASFDSDAINGSGGFVDNYYLPPNNGRQNNTTVRVDTVSGKSYGLLFNIDGSSNLFASDGTTNHQLTTDGSAYDNFKQMAITSDGTTAKLLAGGNTFTLGESTYHGSDRLVFGQSSSSGQGSAIWNHVLLEENLPGNPYAWYRADQGVLESDGTTAEDGEAVTTWQDISGNGRHLTRVSGGGNPLLQTGELNGNPIVEFNNNAGIWANSASEFGTINQPNTVFVVTRVDSPNTGDYVFDSSSFAGRNALFAGQSSNLTDWQLYAGTVLDSLPYPTGTFQIHTAVFDGTDSLHAINGYNYTSGNTGAQALAGLILGARANATQLLDGAIAEVIVYDGVLTDADRDAVENYLGGKYDIQILVPEPATVSIWGLGLLGLAWFGRRRRKA